eukprot:9044170-Alexandrium_andersonii.AAC.1
MPAPEGEKGGTPTAALALRRVSESCLRPKARRGGHRQGKGTAGGGGKARRAGPRAEPNFALTA